jgi:hypothetical protein
MANPKTPSETDAKMLLMKTFYFHDQNGKILSLIYGSLALDA